ncbi:MAG: hypothetical protein EOO15_06235 [Chitinophagaceae bacterium]|nr:MAG: hypothetical protein EOO15_06235 [Chitinophagaceae bacterium]
MKHLFSGMMLLCSVGLLSAQEQSSPLTAYVSNHIARIAGPSVAPAEAVVEKAPAARMSLVSQRKTYFRLGERLITLNRQATDESVPYIFISLHNNETAIAEAARRSIFAQGGTLLELLNDNQREIEFTLFEKELSVDPNNIFTPKGRNRELSINSKVDAVISRQLNSFSQFILEEIPYDKTIVSVHSNEAGEATVNDYTRNGSRERDAVQVFVNPEQNASDFFVTTDKAIFQQLKDKKFNVVLFGARSKDDGSLAVYCSRMHRNYVGIETGRGHDAQQEAMIAAIAESMR